MQHTSQTLYNQRTINDVHDLYQKCQAGNANVKVSDALYVDLATNEPSIAVQGEISTINCTAVLKWGDNQINGRLNAGIKAGSVDVSASISPSNVGMSTGMYAGRAQIGGDLQLGPWKVGGDLEGNVGVGGNVGGGITYNNHELCIKAGGGISAGFGGKLEARSCLDFGFFGFK